MIKQVKAGTLSMIRIAVDGPGGAGKSTIAKILADRLGIEYIDTGAMYRAIALKICRTATSLDDDKALRDMLDATALDFRDNRIFLDGEDVSGQIRTQDVSMMASDSSKLKSVRGKLVALQKEIAASKSVVMDGRDIGTNVITDAEVKIFLTADPMVRAKRRYEQLLEAGKEASLEKIFEETQARDHQDTHRELNPLKKADDAILLDTSDMTIDEAVGFIIEKTQHR